MSKDFRATIRRESPRAQAWLEVFGSCEVFLKSFMPTPASAPGVPEGLFYMLDLQELTPEQRTRLIAHIARKFGLEEEEVFSDLDTIGCPILGDDVTLTVFNPIKWL